ncbi:uncharacterized protein JCM10292_001466 [Rhodotorula paludigena]|uniref:uncharacterized protein n=1 Tax=Rhodotorula paludigena TaxID=86838 RepID=UPI0031782B4C
MDSGYAGSLDFFVSSDQHNSFGDAQVAGNWAQGGAANGTPDAGLSHDDLAWLEQQLSLAAAASPSGVGEQQLSPPPSEPIPHQPHAFPPVSNARFHPYQLPPERAQRLRPPGSNAHLNLLAAVAQPHLGAPQPPHHAQQQQHHQYSHAHTPSLDALQWPSFGAFAPSFAPVSAPPLLPTPPAAVPSFAKPLGAVLYPPHDSASPVLLPDEPTPTYPPAPHASPATPSTMPPIRSSPHPPSPLSGTPSSAPSRANRPRSRSAPPLASGSSFRSNPSASFTHSSSPSFANANKAQHQHAAQLSSLFSWLDAQRWSFATLFTALSDVAATAPAPLRQEHKRRMDDFLALDEPLGSVAASGADGSDEQGRALLREAKRRWALKRRNEKGKGKALEEDEVEEKGPDEVVRMWEDLGGLGRRTEGNMAHAVRELHSNVHEGAVAGSVIRRIINRYGEAYKEASVDMKRLDAALSRPPEPHVTSAPREASVWTGTLVIPPTQADVLQAWLMNPARPAMEGERGKIDAEHMRVYSSLSPLDLHARGAELCRVILLRDAGAMRLYGHHFDRLQTFKVGPLLAPIDTCGFGAYDDASLWHHALQTYLQLCVRYPAFRDGKDATITILPDLPPPVHPTPLETILIDRALHDHWEHLRVFLLQDHGGLLRSAVRSFTGVKLSKVDLLSVCDDTKAVMLALARNKKNPNDRFLPYDPSISQIRNAWRQQAFYDATADLVIWSAATTHFLELSALYPDAALGVRDLPGLESLLGKSAAMQR